ncbi:MAG TPA: rhomboid family intramembrane serine protease [Gemmatimonadaceae bacterium]|nr:rhomboid family intramembrane serine protease [Gemmatimonadaceae bacterium]
MDSDRAPDLVMSRPPAAHAVRWLIALNVAVYFVQLTLISAADMRSWLGFTSGDLDSAWTIATYMFVHTSFWPLAINTYVLWLLGTALELDWGTAQFAGYFALCGVGAWIMELLVVRSGVLIGASGAVMGVALAYASRWPEERVRVLGVVPMRARWIAGMLVLGGLGTALVAAARADLSPLAQFGGLAAAWAYLRTAGAMHIDRLRPRVAPVIDDTDEGPARAIPPRAVPRQRSEREPREVDDIVQQSQAAVAERAIPARTRDANRPPAASSAELNSLLDKISAEGIDALTPTERDRLQAAARRLRDR